MTVADLYLLPLKKRAEQNATKWADFTRTPAEHLLILTEEVGEVARAMQTGYDGYQWPPAYSHDVMRELIDAGAVVLAMMIACGEALDE
jgi:NTP pyrophosphatase (non-canonical NTP hydrolase)